MKNAVVLRNEARMRMYLAATAWALGAVLGAICGMAVLLTTRLGEIIDRRLDAIVGAIFIILCALAFYFAYYLFGA